MGVLEVHGESAKDCRVIAGKSNQPIAFPAQQTTSALFARLFSGDVSDVVCVVVVDVKWRSGRVGDSRPASAGAYASLLKQKL